MREAGKRGITALALTDHDTLGGLESARNEAEASGIHFIPGIEISIKWAGEGSVPGLGPGGEFHLLGLGIKSPSPAFLAAIGDLSRRREERNREILDRMHELSIDASWEDVLALSGGHSVGRPHFASLLVEKKIVRNREQAFIRYLGKGKPFFIPKAGLEFETAAAAIKESGGIAVLAHPMSLFLAWGRLPDQIKNLKERGLDGLEAWHPTAKVSSCKRLEELGKELGLIVTAGSDFHGEGRPDRKLGLTSGGKKIDESFLEAIPQLSG